MKAFATTILNLSETNSQLEKQQLLSQYFLTTTEEDLLWSVALLSGHKPKRTIRTSLLKSWCIEEAGIDEWLLDESYQHVGDLAETISLLLATKKKSVK